MTVTWQVNPYRHIRGDMIVPGDKSISHRALMLAAIAQGTSHVQGFLMGEDCLATQRALQALGVNIQQDAQGLTVHGVGLHGLQASQRPLDMGNAGTAMRLFSGLLAGQAFDSVLTGDTSLCQRPMGRVIEPLEQMGACIDSHQQRAPLTLRGGQQLQAIDYTLPVASAQVKSCLLLAGLYAQGTTIIHEPTPTRDHTERMLTAFGISLQKQAGALSITGGQPLQATALRVPGDISSAAFFIVAATLAQQGELVIRNIGCNPTRDGVVHILRLMGANIEFLEQSIQGGEPIATLRIRPASLKGIDIPADYVANAIDEFPVLFVAAAAAQGVTRLRGAKELRVKESDRLASMAQALSQLGVDLTLYEDGIDIVGGIKQGGVVNSQGDHRVAMAMAVAAASTPTAIIIHNCQPVETSFPDFVTCFQSVGGDLCQQ